MSLITSEQSKRWPGGCVIWEFGPGLLDPEIARYRTSMEEWEGKANVRFLPRTTQHTYVTLRGDDNIDGVSHSALGMQGGEQSVYLEPLTEDNNRARTARHELGHTIGLYHEHLRCDRDDFVKVNENIKLERWGDYHPQRCGSEVQTSGPYDFSSVMHYNPSSGATTDGKIDLQGRDAANQTLLGNSSRSNISDGDVDAVNMLHGGDAHIYQLTGDGQIEKTLHQYNWTSGWSFATHFLMDARNFIMLLKRKDGSMHMHSVNHDGTIGNRVQTTHLPLWLISPIKYTILIGNYMLLYRRTTGRLIIKNINVDGSLGEDVTNEKIESGWTTIRQYTIGGDNFLLLLNASTGVWRVWKIHWDGKVGSPVQAGQWNPGVTFAEPYIAGGNRYLFRLKMADGGMSIKRILDSGKISAAETDSRDLGNSFTSAHTYEVNGNTYIMMLKQSGSLEIRKLLSNGKLGATTDRREFEPGWAVKTIYHSGPWTYAMLIKS